LMFTGSMRATKATKERIIFCKSNHFLSLMVFTIPVICQYSGQPLSQRRN
jgi:hypothetical protein